MASSMDIIDFVKEGETALKDISFSIADGRISSILPSDRLVVYLNITTREDKKFCVRLNSSGFKVVGNEYDTADDDDKESGTYETIYALLENISESYCKQFSELLSEKLNQLQQHEQNNEN
jgi:hypothetical protein